jgi:hypothetical protein
LLICQSTITETPMRFLNTGGSAFKIKAKENLKQSAPPAA